MSFDMSDWYGKKWILSRLPDEPSKACVITM